MNKTINLLLALLLLSFIQTTYDTRAQSTNKITLISSTFSENTIIPNKHSCDFDNVSPPLTWSNVPKNTKSFAIIMDDPDAPSKVFAHWVIFNIPGDATSLPEGIISTAILEDGTKQGTNDTNQIGYFGPCPPPGKPHRYVFKIYALDTLLNLESITTKQLLLKAMKKHILAKGKLVGKYKTN